MQYTEEELKKILKKHWGWLNDEEGGKRADLREADLREARLRGARLRGAYLREARLRGARLRGADLQGADLQRADLRGADLREADLREARLRGARLRGARLRGADLQGADLREAYLRGADLRGARLRGADLQGAGLRGADLREADLSNCILDGINWLAYIGIVPDHQGTARAFKIVGGEGKRAGEGIHQGGINYLQSDKFKVDNIDTDVFNHCGAGINLATFQWCLNNREKDTDRLIMFSFNVKDAICPVATDGKFRVSQCRRVGECDWQGNLKKERYDTL